MKGKHKILKQSSAVTNTLCSNMLVSLFNRLILFHVCNFLIIQYNKTLFIYVRAITNVISGILNHMYINSGQDHEFSQTELRCNWISNWTLVYCANSLHA